MGKAGESSSRLDSRWSDLPREHRRWIVYNAILITGLINLLMNGVITWLMVRGRQWVPLWTLPLPGRANIITDSIGTFFMLPFITCLLVTTGVRREIRVGRLAPLADTSWSQPLLARLPVGRLRRGAVLGGLCAVALSPLCALVLVGVDAGGLSTTGFVLYKAVFGLVLGAIVTPVIALCAMADTVGSVDPGAHAVQVGVRS